MTGSVEEQVADVLRQTSVDVGAEVIARATNMFGALGTEVRERLLAVIRDPNPHTWNNAYSIVVNGHVGRSRTLWQAVLRVDPKMKLPVMNLPVEQRWSYVPDALTIVTAINKAIAERRSDR